MTDSFEAEVAQLLIGLASDDAVERERARNALVEIGSPSLPGLLKALSDKRQRIRWEAAKSLEGIADPAAAEALAEALGDEDGDVRWVAGEALIALRTAALKPVLIGLTRSRDSEGMYKAAHHVLHDLSSRSELTLLLQPVLEAFEQPEPELAVPVAAHEVVKGLK